MRVLLRRFSPALVCYALSTVFLALGWYIEGVLPGEGWYLIWCSGLFSGVGTVAFGMEAV